MHKYACFASAYGVCYFGCGKHSTHGEVACREAFADAHDIGFDARMFACKESACAPEARCYFVKYQQYAVLVAQLASLAQILRIVKPHAAGTLNDRFKNQCS